MPVAHSVFFPLDLSEWMDGSSPLSHLMQTFFFRVVCVCFRPSASPSVCNLSVCLSVCLSVYLGWLAVGCLGWPVWVWVGHRSNRTDRPRNWRLTESNQ